MGLWHTQGSPNLGQMTWPYNNQQQRKKKKRICKIVDLAVPANHRIKLKECEKKDKYLDLARELKKTMEHESDGDTNYNRWVPYSNQRIDTGIWGQGNKRTSGDDSNDSIIKKGQNSENSSGDWVGTCLLYSCEKPLANAGVKNFLKIGKL